MRSRKVIPYIFLGVLILILIFVGGVQYGKVVEKQNKAISFVLSITPTQKPMPVSEKMVSLSPYVNKSCGIQFLYPSNVEKTKESTSSALFMQKNKQILSLTCDPKDTQTINDFKNATDSMKLKNQTVRSKLITKSGQQMYMLVISNNLNGRTIYVTIDKDFYPVFESTYQLTP